MESPQPVNKCVHQLSVSARGKRGKLLLTIYLTTWRNPYGSESEEYHMKIGSDGYISLNDVLQPGLPKKLKNHEWPPRPGKGFLCVYSVKSPPTITRGYYTPGADDDYYDPCREQHVVLQRKTSSGVYHDTSDASFVDMCVFLGLIIKHKQSYPRAGYPDECAQLAKLFHCLPAEKLANARINIAESFYPPLRITACPKRKDELDE